VVPVEDVFEGYLALLTDSAVFVKELFGDLEIRGTYPYSDLGHVEIKDGFGGKEVHATWGDKTLRLRRLSDEHATLVANALRGRGVGSAAAPAPTPTPSPAAKAPPPLSSRREGHTHRQGAERRPHTPEASRSTAPSEAETQNEPASDDAATAHEVADRATKPKKRGCFMTSLYIGVPLLLLWYLAELVGDQSQFEQRFVIDEERLAALAARLDESAKTIAALEQRLAALETKTQPALAPQPANTETPEPSPTQEQPPAAADIALSSEVYAVGIGKAAARGPAQAFLTLVMFCDFQSPECAAAQSVLAPALSTFAKELKLVYRHLPMTFHEQAMAAAHVAECIRDQGVGKFWRFHDAIFSNPALLASAKPEQILETAELGLDVPKARKCVERERFKARIEADVALAAQFGVSRVPAFFLNGRWVSGSPTEAQWLTLLARELEAAQQSGIAKAKYYEQAVLQAGQTSRSAVP
jgi:protein-disulfide isomerase